MSRTHLELKKMELKKEQLELDHKLKMERETLTHDNIMEELKLMGEYGITTYNRSNRHTSKEASLNKLKP